MNKVEYFEMVEKELNSIKELIKKKNSDYTNGDKDSSPFENFQASEKLGICSAEQGLLLRLLDKVQRIKTYILRGKLSVENEGYKDSIHDVIGYSLLLMGLLKEQEEQSKQVTSGLVNQISSLNKEPNAQPKSSKAKNEW